ncbi:XRE family transcriptional regulator [Hyalangium gracile]|uniref:XRE family transcriptional regulator n=1 Tax=Hyalangium gracile TaxID=394092 RepID=UPI001CC9F6FE|nr:XRE family transcriptional regulator [Hyalangium gracile]
MKHGINGFVPERLALVLAARRLSQVQLAAMVGVSPSTISKWHTRQQAPEAETLERLAAVVNVSSEWFTRPIEVEASKPLFRSNAAAHSAARAMLKARLHLGHELAHLLADFVDLPEVNVPSRTFTTPEQISTEDIEAAATECRARWHLGGGPIPNVALALENAGTILVREETGVAQIEGLSAWSTTLARPLVLLVADKDNGFRGRYDASHELGHLVLHRHVPEATAREQHNEMERQAHAFAGAFLMPSESFAAQVRTPVTLDSLLLLKVRWGVSVAAMIMRLSALKIIDEHQKMALFKRRSARWGAKAEPHDSAWPPEEPRLLRRTIDLLVSENVLPLNGVVRHVGTSARDVVMLAGLPERYFEKPATVVEFPKIKRQPEPPTSHSDGTIGELVTFPRRG